MTPESLRIAVAINPQASFGMRHDVGHRVVAALTAAGHDATGISQPNGELLRREATLAVEAGAEVLVVVGGDGMISLGVNIVAGTSVPLGIVPTGTGNDMALGLNLPLDDDEAAIAALLGFLERGPRAIDAGRVHQAGLTTWFAGILSAGFDAVVNERANRMSYPRGKSKYTLAMVRELLTFKPAEYTVTADGVTSATRAMLISVANNQALGGGMRMVPDAQLDDGLLDLFIVEPLSKLAFLRMFPKVFSGTHTSIPEVRLSRVKSVRLESPGAIAYADGERVGPLPVDVDIVPGALQVLA